MNQQELFKSDLLRLVLDKRSEVQLEAAGRISNRIYAPGGVLCPECGKVVVQIDLGDIFGTIQHQRKSCPWVLNRKQRGSGT